MTDENVPPPPASLGTIFDWFAALQDDQRSLMTWLLLDQPLRLALAQMWIWNQLDVDALDMVGRNRDDLAHALTPRDASHPLFPSMLEAHVARWRSTYQAICNGGGVRDDTGVLHAWNPVGVDLELVVLTLPGEVEGVLAEGRGVRSHRFVSRLTNGSWTIAALAGRMPIPGWPPSEQDVGQPT